MPAVPDLVAAFLDELFTLQPETATYVGDHRFDDRWSDYSEAGRAERLAFVDRWTATFTALDPSTLSADDRIDRDLVLGELDSARFADDVLREETWAPMVWVYVLGGGLHPLLTRDFAPLVVRLVSATGRLEGIPAVLEQARSVGANPDHRSRSSTRTSRQADLVAGLARDAVARAEAADVDPTWPRSFPGSGQAGRAAAELEAMAEHLATQVV